MRGNRLDSRLPTYRIKPIFVPMTTTSSSFWGLTKEQIHSLITGIIYLRPSGSKDTLFGHQVAMMNSILIVWTSLLASYSSLASLILIMTWRPISCVRRVWQNCWKTNGLSRVTILCLLHYSSKSSLLSLLSPSFSSVLDSWIS